MCEASGELAYGLHLLRLQQRCLSLFTCLDLRAEFLRPQRHGALELFSVACQRIGSGTKRIADLVQFAHPAIQFANRYAARYRLGRSRQYFYRPPDRLSHPPSQEQAQGEDCSTAAEGQELCAPAGRVNKSSGHANRHGPAGHGGSSKCRVNGNSFACNVRKPAFDRPRDRLPDYRRRRLAEKAIELAIARDYDAFAIEYRDYPVGRKIWLAQQL